MVDTKVLAEPRENIHIVYAGNLDSDESRVANNLVADKIAKIRVIVSNMIM